MQISLKNFNQMQSKGNVFTLMFVGSQQPWTFPTLKGCETACQLHFRRWPSPSQCYFQTAVDFYSNCTKGWTFSFKHFSTKSLFIFFTSKKVVQLLQLSGTTTVVTTTTVFDCCYNVIFMPSLRNRSYFF